MPKKNLNKDNASIQKKKFTISNNQTKNISSLEKFSKNKNKKKNIKIIEDDSFEEEIKVVEKNIRKTKKQKQKYPKDDDDYNNEESSLDSISTNKTDDIIFKKEIRYPKNDLNQSISNAPRKKEKSINKKITLDENGFKRRKKSKIISRNKNKSQNKNKRNTISIFKNPYLEEEDEKSNDNTDNYDESDFEYDSDYYKQEIKKEKKSNGKKYYKKDKEDIFDDNIYSKSSILGLDYLPCREKEQKIIYDYIKNGLLTNGNYNSLYIAGMPGTGKTACVKTVINIMESELNQNNKNIFKKNSKNNYIPPFTKLFICGTEFPSISNVFRAIYNFIFSTKKKQTNKKYTQLLNKFFSNRDEANIAHLNDPSNSHIILVLDEIDFLINKSQNLLYNIFNWTTFEGSKLIVISISNTLDLPNKLTPRIRSRMGNNKIMFKPYNKDELITILKSKGVEYENFTSDALKLSCMKVASINGDLRRIIQILQRAKEIYNLSIKKNSHKKIDKNYIIKASDDLFSSKLTKVIKSLQISEKIIICAILSKYKDVNDNKVKVGDLYEKKDIFIDKYNETIKRNILTIYWEEYQKIIYNLIRLQLLNFCDKPNNNNFMENYITIKFYTDEFIYACNEDKELKPVIDYLTNLISI